MEKKKLREKKKERFKKGKNRAARQASSRLADEQQASSTRRDQKQTKLTNRATTPSDKVTLADRYQGYYLCSTGQTLLLEQV